MSVNTSFDERTEDPWGAHASVYDRVFAPLTGYVARNLLAMAETRLPRDARVLDIACGSGALLLPLMERAAFQRAQGGEDFIVGCDYSPGMVALAQQKALRQGAAGVYRCDVQNGEALSYPDASFEAVFSCFGIFLFADRQAGWREAVRVLTPGGLFATTSWMAPEHNPMMRLQFEAIFAALPSRLREAMTPPDWMRVADAAGLRKDVEAAGLAEVEVSPFRSSFVLPSIQEAWRALLNNPSGGALLRQCNEVELQAVKASFFDGMRHHASGAEGPIMLEACCNLLTARRLS